MKFLLDQDVYAPTRRFLAELGHDVLPVAHIGLAQAGDEELLGVAQERGRIFVARDRDFGSLVFLKGLGLVFSTRFTLNSASCSHRACPSISDIF